MHYGYIISVDCTGSECAGGCTGETCTGEITPEGHCLNGGTEANGYCSCTRGYTGLRCDQGNTLTNHASIASPKQLTPQRMLVAYNKLVGRKTPLPKERRNTYLEPETKTPTIDRRPPAVTATVGSWKASLINGRHRNVALTDS